MEPERGIAVCASFGGPAIDDTYAPGLGVVDDGEHEAQLRIEPRGVEQAQQGAGIAGVADVRGLRQPERSVFIANEEDRLVVLQDGHDLRRVAGPRDRLALELAETYVPRL